MNLVMGCDHAGYLLKEHLKKYLSGSGHTIIDDGCYSEDSVDYPNIAEKVASTLKSGQAELAVLVCGTGQGMAMTANKIRGIRAAVCSDVFSARAAREHNNANILALGARVIGQGTAEMLVDEFLQSQFAGGRHQRRVDLITAIENKNR